MTATREPGPGTVTQNDGAPPETGNPATAPLPTRRIGGRTFTVLFPGLLRPHTEAELRGLETSIARLGFRDPITVDEADGLIDGDTRLGIAERYGLRDVPVNVVPGLCPEAKRELAEQLNLARRHLPPEDIEEFRRQRFARLVAWVEQGLTVRDIASREGYSPSQADRDIQAAFVSRGTKRPRDPRGGARRPKAGDDGTVAALGRSLKKVKQEALVLQALDGTGTRFARWEQVAVGWAEERPDGTVVFHSGEGDGPPAVCLCPLAGE